MFFLLLSLLSPAAFALEGIELHLPGAEEILASGRPYQCRYTAGEKFGFQFLRISEKEVKVQVITNDVLESDASAFVAEIKTQAIIGYHLYFYERKGEFGRYVEFELRNERKSSLDGRFSGLAMQVSARYKKLADGTEKEFLYPDFSRGMACMWVE